jgi:DnaJ-class molecular chaperone
MNKATEPGRSDSAMSPGDQVPPGTAGSGENICPDCGGRGRLRSGQQCPTCDGTGVVIEVVGGGG